MSAFFTMACLAVGVPRLDSAATAVTAAPIPLGPCAPEPAMLPEDRPHYQVSVDFDTRSGKATGSVSIRFRPDRVIDRAVLRLWPNGGVRGPLAPRVSLTQSWVAVGEVGAQTETRVGSVLVAPTIAQLPVNAEAGQLVTVRADFSLVVSGEVNDRISLSRAADRTFVAARLGSFIPVLAWEPGVGWNLTPPTRSGAESSMTVAADWDVRVSVVGAQGVSVLASGEEIEPGHWTSTGERDWAMSVGRFTSADGSLVRSNVSLGPGRRTVLVVVGVAAPLRESAAAYKTRVVRAIRLLSDLYGDYPWPTYTLAITPGLKGGIEFPSHVMQGPGSIGRTTTHEVAHQWFYGLVGNDQGRDPWIDEGLATWAEARADGTLAAFVAKPIPADGLGRAGLPMTYWDVHRASYYRSVYVQTLHALHALGDPGEVDCALARLMGSKGYRVARPSDVIRALSERFPNAPAVLRKHGINAEAG